MNENAIGTIGGDCAVELHRDWDLACWRRSMKYPGPGTGTAWSGLRLGYRLNFREALTRDGIPRIIHGIFDPDPPWPRCLCERRIYRTKGFTDRGAAASVSLVFGVTHDL